jgi:predicted metal-dependent hydrolase
MLFRRIIIRRRVIHPDKARIAFREGQTATIMGKPFTISVSLDPNAKYSTARARDGAVRIRMPAGLKPSQRERHISNLSRRAIARAILPEVEGHVRQLNDMHFRSELGAVRLKDNLSNWGSCSRKNNINLDFRLLLGPREIMDAVIVHELAHTKHRNHSREFYSTLLAAMPDNRQKLRWLRENGHRMTTEQSGTISYPASQEAERKGMPPV